MKNECLVVTTNSLALLDATVDALVDNSNLGNDRNTEDFKYVVIYSSLYVY